MRLLSGSLGGLAIGTFLGLICFLAVLIAPGGISVSLEDGPLEFAVVAFIAVGFLTVGAIGGCLIGLAVAFAEPNPSDATERLGPGGDDPTTRSKSPLPYDDFS